MNLKPLVVTLMLIVAAGAVATPAAASQTGKASTNTEAGAHVAFETTDTAIVDYRVDGQTVVENLSFASESGGQSTASGSLGLSGETAIAASGLNLDSSLSAGASATIRADSGGSVQTYDNNRGVFVVRSGSQDESQGVQLGLSSDSDAESTGDQRVVITTANGSTATVLATGDGNVSVTDSGNVSAETGSNGQIVYRQYDGDRSESDKSQERMIMDGTAAAEVYVQQAAESGDSASQSGQSQAVNVVNYGQNTTVNMTDRSANTVNATVDHTTHSGRAVIMTVSNDAFENAQQATVYVDGEAATKVSSYSAVQSATNGGDNSAYYVDQSASAQATTNVVVGINHFSKRDVSVQSSESAAGSDSTDAGTSESETADNGGTESGLTDNGTSSGSGPGFGLTGALAALAGLALLADRRQ